MKKIYSLVLMAAMLLVGTNAWAQNVAKISDTGTEYQTLEAAWAAVQDGQTIQLISDAPLSNTLWLGTTAMDDSTNVKSIALDLNGWKIEGAESMAWMFHVTHGELIVTSSRPNGSIKQLGANPDNKSDWEIFRVCGSTYKTVNPKTGKVSIKTKTTKNGYYSHLVIGENVKLDARGVGIAVDRNDGKYKTGTVATAGTAATANVYNTNIFKQPTGIKDGKMTYGNYGSAYGVRIDVYGKIEAQKYALKTNGNLGSPISAQTYSANYPAYPKDASNTYEVLPADTAFTPFVRLYGTSDLRVPSTSNATKKPTAVYASGYARWMIEGTCVGSTAVYVKSGELVINDATIHSNYPGAYTPATPHDGSGVNAQGSAIAIESAAQYAGDIDIAIGGDTHVSATNGYAIDEAITLGAGETKVDAITITGGTFQGGDVRTKDEKDPKSEKYVADPVYGTMVVTDVTAVAAATTDTVTITIIGGSSSNGTDSIGNQSLAEFLADQSTTGTKTHITYVEDESGKQTMVISEGEAPATADPTDPTVPTTWSFIAGQAATQTRPSYQWTAIETDATIASGTVKLGELQINAATGSDQQKLTIASGATLQVERLVMNANAQIVVEAGGKLIVDGAQGITAPSVNNIILKTSDAAQAMFLIKPVENGSNRHPKATVQFTSRSYVNSASDYAWQRFGIPANGKLNEVTAEKAGSAVPTAFGFFNYETGAWETLGYIHTAGKTMDYDKMANPFEYYQLLNNISQKGTVVTMKGELVGNDNPLLHALGNSWNGYANSYMAPISGVKLLSLIPDGTIDKAFYLYKIDDNGQATWEPASIPFMQDILPMQPFLLRNSQAAADVTINYGTAVYNPAMGIVPNNAPAQRNTIDAMTKVKMIVKGANGTDFVGVVEDETLSAEFDNGYDAVKYMNDGINMYVTADEKMAIFATDNLDNTYVGFQTVNGGTYTIEFANVHGAELTLIDLETGARVAMVEGNTYEFTAAANSVNDYRFEIVESAKLPTAIDNTEAVKSAKGIYTITGQYLGEMNVWNTLPAGVYVINGEKRVK